MTIYNGISFLGIFVILFIAWLLSANRRIMNWRAIAWGLAAQLVLGLCIFVVPAGRRVLLGLNDLVDRLLAASNAGTSFVFGPLAIPPGMPGSPGFILAIQSLPTIIFFSAIMAVLYYIGFMPLLIGLFSRFFSRFMRVSGAEAMSVSANIFVGVESGFVVKPHIGKMTSSELCTILAAGLATVASSTLALYVFILREQFPGIAGHLISASILAAPASIVLSKILLPETGTPLTLGTHVRPHYIRESSLFEAIIKGSTDGLQVIFGIVALLIAVLGMVALADNLLGWAGAYINAAFHIHFAWNFRNILGLAFYPFPFIMGVVPADARLVAAIIGERLVMTEVVSYQDLAKAMSAGLLRDPRSAVITAYALCGFAHLASLAIFTGGFVALAPSRMKDISGVAVRALVAATLACFMIACVAGLFTVDGAGVLLGR